MQNRAIYSSPIGKILITEADGAITSLVFSDCDVHLSPAESPALQDTVHWLDDYFAGKAPDPAQIPLRLSGTGFQQQVWQILRSIPYGKSLTYGNIAKRISPKMSAQAVGGAVGRNPISIIVPCHRILGAGSRLTGYAFGLDRKIALLELENIPYR